MSLILNTLIADVFLIQILMDLIRPQVYMHTRKTNRIIAIHQNRGSGTR